MLEHLKPPLHLPDLRVICISVIVSIQRVKMQVHHYLDFDLIVNRHKQEPFVGNYLRDRDMN